VNTINIKLNYTGEVLLNNEFRTNAPLDITWFPNTDLFIDTGFEKITVNEQADAVITPKVPTSELEEIPCKSLRLVKNNVARYLIVDEKFAYKLPTE